MWKKRWKEHLILIVLCGGFAFAGFYLLDKGTLVFRIGGVVAFIIAFAAHLYQLSII